MKTLPKYIDIKIHSMIDLITNSSSEMFVTATGKTLKVVKEIINNVLKMGKSEFTADDFFEFSLTCEDWDDDKGKYTTKKVTEEMMTEFSERESPPTVTLKVKAKDTSDKLGKATAELLSDLEDLFETGERLT